jgi:hypothetical protein
MALLRDLPLVMMERDALPGMPMSMLECKLLEGEPLAGASLYAGCTPGRAPLVIGFPWASLRGDVYCVGELSQVVSNVLLLERGKPLDEARTRVAIVEKVYFLPWMSDARAALRRARPKRAARRSRPGHAQRSTSMNG